MRARSSLALHRAVVRQGCCSASSRAAGAATTASATATPNAAAAAALQQQHAAGLLGSSSSGASVSGRAGVAARRVGPAAASALPLQWPMQPQRAFSVETGGVAPTPVEPPPPLDPPVRACVRCAWNGIVQHAIGVL